MTLEIFREIIEVLRYVTNIYTLIGFLCLLCVYLIAHHHIEPSRLTVFFTSFFKREMSVKNKKDIVSLLFVSIIIIVILFLHYIYEKALYEKEIPIARDGQQELYKGVEVKLIDITTLKSQEYNKTLGDDEERVSVYRTVFERAGVKGYKQTARDAMTMDEDQWNEFLKSLNELSRLRVERTPFATFRIYIDGEEDLSFENRYFFKGTIVKVGAVGKAPPIVKFRLKNVYDTYDIYSDERETVVVQLVK